MRKISLILIWIFAIAFISENSLYASKYDSKVLAKIGDDNITYKEIEKAYQKNMNRSEKEFSEISKDELKKFLDLYINFKLKVKDAIDRGFDKDPSLNADIETSRRTLAESFYFEKEALNPSIEKMMKRRKWEIQMAVILLQYKDMQKPDTLEALKRAKTVMSQLKNGAEFSYLAETFSDDAQSRKNGGVVESYISSGRIHRAIEDAIFSIDKIGEVYPEIIKTEYGYFIIKLLDKVERKLRYPRHILISGDSDSKEDMEKAKAKAESILKNIKDGQNFADLAMEYSDDPSSAIRGGEFEKWYSRTDGFIGSGRNLVPEFESVLFSLKVGEVSEPIKTQYGYHIVRCDSIKDYDMKIEEKEVKEKYKRLYYQADKLEIYRKLRKEAGFKYNDDVVEELVNHIDKNKEKFTNDWANKLPEDLINKELFSINSRSFKVKDLVDQFKTNMVLRTQNMQRSHIMHTMNEIANPYVFETEIQKLEKNDQEFIRLMEEFKYGLLIFKVDELEVWNKLKFDSTKARKYWNERKENFRTLDKYDIQEIYVLDDSLAQDIKRTALTGRSFSDLAKSHTQRAGFREKEGKWGVISVKEALAAKVQKLSPKKGDIIGPIETERGYSVIKILDHFPPTVKSFEEAIPDFAASFNEMVQNELTKQWMNRIKEKYPVQIEEGTINSIFK